MYELKLRTAARRELESMMKELAAELKGMADDLKQKAKIDDDNEPYETMFTILDCYIPSMKNHYQKRFEEFEDKEIHYESVS